MCRFRVQSEGLRIRVDHRMTGSVEPNVHRVGMWKRKILFESQSLHKAFTYAFGLDGHDSKLQLRTSVIASIVVQSLQSTTNECEPDCNRGSLLHQSP